MTKASIFIFAKFAHFLESKVELGKQKAIESKDLLAIEKDVLGANTKNKVQIDYLFGLYLSYGSLNVGLIRQCCLLVYFFG